MQNLIVEKESKNNYIKPSETQTHKKLSIKDIEKFYSNKNSGFSRFGLEYERISLDKNTLFSASFEKVTKIISHFAQIENWDLIYDEENIIGAKDSNGTSISLEPGCQLEISLAPEESIIDIDSKASKIIKLLDEIAKIYDVIFLGYGINPKNSAEDIKLISKRRYEIMNSYLPNCFMGELSPNMMRKTAGIQVNIDFEDKNDAYLKLKFFNLISPFMTALFANSPIENDTLTDNHSNRARAWLYTGKSRCNFFYGNIFKGLKKYGNVFKNYIKEVLDVPMVYIERNNKIIPICGKINFTQFLKDGYNGYSAQYEDYILHQSLCFPDVRLKNYIEIRNHDSSNYATALCLVAFYKGLEKANFKKLLKQFKFLKLNKIDEYNKKIIKEGLCISVAPNICGWDVVAKLFNIAKNNLNSKERTYLRPVLEMLSKRKTQADILIEYDIKNAKELVEFLN